MLTRGIYVTKPKRSVSKQGHLQPRCHAKARSQSRQLQVLFLFWFFCLITGIKRHTQTNNWRKITMQRTASLEGTKNRHDFLIHEDLLSLMDFTTVVKEKP